MPLSSVEAQVGRFRVWCGNLGALQQAHHSLDYRLRDAATMKSNVSKLLEQLQSHVQESKCTGYDPFGSGHVPDVNGD